MHYPVHCACHLSVILFISAAPFLNSRPLCPRQVHQTTKCPGPANDILYQTHVHEPGGSPHIPCRWYPILALTMILALSWVASASYLYP